MISQIGCLHRANKALSKYAITLKLLKMLRIIMTILCRMTPASHAKWQSMIAQRDTRLITCSQKPWSSYNGTISTDAEGPQSIQILTLTAEVQIVQGSAVQMSVRRACTTTITWASFLGLISVCRVVIPSVRQSWISGHPLQEKRGIAHACPAGWHFPIIL